MPSEPTKAALEAACNAMAWLMCEPDNRRTVRTDVVARIIDEAMAEERAEIEKWRASSDYDPGRSERVPEGLRGDRDWWERTCGYWHQRAQEAISSEQRLIQERDSLCAALRELREAAQEEKPSLECARRVFQLCAEAGDPIAKRHQEAILHALRSAKS